MSELRKCTTYYLGEKVTGLALLMTFNGPPVAQFHLVRSMGSMAELEEEARQYNAMVRAYWGRRGAATLEFNVGPELTFCQIHVKQEHWDAVRLGQGRGVLAALEHALSAQCKYFPLPGGSYDARVAHS